MHVDQTHEIRCGTGTHGTFRSVLSPPLRGIRCARTLKGAVRSSRVRVSQRLSALCASLDITLSDAGARSSGNDDDDDATCELDYGLPTCSVCLCKPVDAALKPCFHAGFCEDCAGMLEKRGFACPICRGRVSGVQKIYL